MFLGFICQFVGLGYPTLGPIDTVTQPAPWVIRQWSIAIVD